MSAGSTHQEVIDTVSKACAFGHLDKLTAFIAADPTCIHRSDEAGYFPLQWSALNNRVAEAALLLQHGAMINAVDSTGQTALHWAAVRGSLPVMELLLDAHANYELRDNRGYTVCHVASQYGQTGVLYYLALKWDVQVDLQDNDGRTPLHWAAYKGYADTVRLLLVLDARYTLADREGCTPLHWVAIKGHGEAAEVLLQGGSTTVLTYKDMTGTTPPQLAMDKGHRYLSRHLSEYKRTHEMCPAWLSSTQLCPIIWVITLGLLAAFIHKVMMVPLLPLSLHLKLWALCTPVFCGIGLVLLYLTTTSDPGFIKTGWDTHSDGKRREAAIAGGTPLLSGTHKSLDSPALWQGNWHQICVSCHIVRPLRAKHCAVTDRCIEVFDHYCPWVGNAIGKGNRHLFLSFLLLELFGIVVAAVVAILQIRRAIKIDDWAATGLVWMIAFVAGDIFMGISVASLAVAQLSQVVRNVTTNELANWHRYKHMQNGNEFHNPFSHGCYANFVEAFSPGSTPMSPVCLPDDRKLAATSNGGGATRLPVSNGWTVNGAGG